MTTAGATADSEESAGGLAAGLWLLAAALAVNSALGPFGIGTVTYPLSETLVTQTVGLEAVSVLVVAPWAAAAGVLVRRGHRAGPIAAIPPAGYTAYMFAQYVVGPSYVTYRPIQLLHLGVFVLGGGLLVAAWRRARAADPATAPASGTRHAVALLLLAAFVTARYVPAIAGMLAGGPLGPEAAADPAMYWSIVLLDLGVVVPVTVAAAVGLWRDAAWARTAHPAIAGWFALVPISVAAMGLAMWLRDDPYASLAQVAVLGAAAFVFTAYAAAVYRPLVQTAGATD